MRRVLLMMTLVGLLVAATACGGDGTKKVSVPGGDGEVEVTTGGELPSDFPDDFPVFEGAKLMGSVKGEQEGQAGFFATWETDASAQEVIDFYTERLDRDPWKTAGVFSSDDGALISFVRADDEDVGGAVTVSANGKTQFVVFYGEGADFGLDDTSDGEAETVPAEEEAAPEEEAEAPAAELPEEVSLPGDYPSDIAPIPDGARVTGASAISSEGTESFIVSYLIEDDPESVGDFYESEVGSGWSQTGRFTSEGIVTLTYEEDGGDGSLLISVSESDAFDGYADVGIILTVAE